MIPLVLSFFMDYKCNYFCDHCSVRAGPHRNNPFPLEAIKKLLDEGKKIGFKVVVFTGGEPTLDMDKLLAALRYAKNLGYITRVVTNGFWATTFEKAMDVLSKMKDAGLDEINTSFDDYHLDIPKRRWSVDPAQYVYIVKASLKLNIRIGIGLIYDSNSLITRDFATKFFSLYLGLTPQEIEKHIKFVVDVPARLGRASTEIPDEMILQRELPISGCNDIGKVYGLHPDGRITVCCGHAIFATDAYDIGNWKTEENPLSKARERASQNLIYWWLWTNGPKKILKEIGINERTTHICDACKILVVDNRDKLIEYLKAHKNEILVNDVLLNNRAHETVEFIKRNGIEV